MQDSPAGVMDATYARGRERKPALRFRYRVRARLAVEAYLCRTDFGGEHAVLELGAAEGRTLLEMRRLLGGLGRYAGVELSDGLLAQAPALPPGVELLRADVTALPPDLEPGSFTLVTALALLEHLPDPAACVAEAFRMLRPGGVFVATCPHPLWDELAGHLRLVADEHHEQGLTGAAMVALAEQAGFEAAEFRPFMFSAVGLLPYLRVPITPRRALELDARIRSAAPWADFGYVNQAVVARKPEAP